MKLLLLKTLLQRRARDEGFTLPMVIALGLVMLLLGATSIVRSNEENIAAINTNSSSDALAIAEVGIARYRELLNQNRILTIYDHDKWDKNSVAVDFLGNGTTRNINVRAQACNNMNRTPTGWFDDNKAGTNVKPNDTTKWWEVKQNLADDSIGEYRLVSYKYHNDNSLTDDDNGQFAPNDDEANTTDVFGYNNTTYNSATNVGYKTRGTLTVQGRSKNGNEAQIKVEIPLRINDLENFAPVLWVRSGAIANPGSLNVPDVDNIVLRNAFTGCPAPAAIDSNDNVISDPRLMPSVFSFAGIPNNKKNFLADVNKNTTSAEIILPRPKTTADKQDDDGRFLYQTNGAADNDLIINGNNFVTDGIAKVIVRVPGNISITAPAGGGTLTVGNENAAQVDSAGDFTNFDNGNTTNTNVSSQNLELHVLGNVAAGRTITINPNGGTVNIEAFIHAPNATLEVTGTGTVNINGAIWVNSYVNNSSATVNIRSDKTDTTTTAEPSYKFYTSSEIITPRPLTSSPTNWIKEEVD